MFIPRRRPPVHPGGSLHLAGTMDNAVLHCNMRHSQRREAQFESSFYAKIALECFSQLLL